MLKTLGAGAVTLVKEALDYCGLSHRPLGDEILLFGSGK